MGTPFYLEILGIDIYYLDGAEMSNEKEIPEISRALVNIIVHTLTSFRTDKN